MKAYSELSREELMELREQLLAAYEEKKALGDVYKRQIYIRI